MKPKTAEDIALEICNNRTTYEHGAQKIDSYASRLVQDARADERRRTIHDINCRVRHEIKELDKIGVIDGKTTVLARISAAILQGTAPAKRPLSEVFAELRAEYGADFDRAFPEPAKVSEDVERDEPRIGDFIAWIYFGDLKANIYSQALADAFAAEGIQPFLLLRREDVENRRLVARLKEGR
jgi:hypothetical protein